MILSVRKVLKDFEISEDRKSPLMLETSVGNLDQI